jgi:Fur family ferric uptake transcriptional regulator
VFRLHEHFNAEDLYAKVKLVTRDVSLATVYRTLPLLMEAGLVQHALRSSGRDRFEHIYGHPKHVHWLCSSCGAIQETDLQALLPAITQQADAIRFKTDDIELSIRGICWKCAVNENENHNDKK